MAHDPAEFADLFARPAPPSRRRPRRDDIVTYRVRVDLAGTKPPPWRRLELASDLMLDEVHDIIQATFGWQDYHLHRFGSGPEYSSPETEYYLMPFEVQEGETGIPEEQVRLDEVLVGRGEKLYYNYDFGDDWQHVIELEVVLPRVADAPRAMCTDGRRPARAEDCGGIDGYELICAAIEPTHPDHAAGVSEYARMFGDDIDPAGWAPTPFELDEINRNLMELGIDQARPDVDVPEPLQNLINAVRTTPGQRDLRRMVAEALAVEPKPVASETAARMVQPYTWLINRVGANGISLTSAGYVPPVHVEAATTELGLDEIWIGKGNREVQTLPVLKLRESAQTMGLLRKYRGKLLLTERGRRLQTDPVALWWHLADRMPLKSRDRCEEQAGLLLLIAVAAERTTGVTATVTRFLDAIGWMSADRTPLSDAATSYASWDTKAVLRQLGAFGDNRTFGGDSRLTPDGIDFTRAALRSWPG